MSKIIACIDSSSNIESICNLAAFAARNSENKLAILHAIDHHSEQAKNSDLSGAIGLGVKSELLEELTKLDEEQSKAQIKEGKLLLEKAEQNLNQQGFDNVKIIHQHGSFAEVLQDVKASLIVIGENSRKDKNRSDTNLEDITKEIHTPILIAKEDANSQKIEKILIAFDGSEMANKAVKYIASNPVFKGLECHLLKVAKDNPENQESIKSAQEKLQNSDFKVSATIIEGEDVAQVIQDYISANNINLAVIGAYQHSKLRHLIFGSKTEELIKKSQISLLLIS